MTGNDLGKNSTLTAMEIDIIVQKSVRETFITLGADLSDNKAVQEMQKDFAYMRRQRIGGENIADWIRRAGIASVVAGALWALWQGLKVALFAKGVAP